MDSNTRVELVVTASVCAMYTVWAVIDYFVFELPKLEYMKAYPRSRLLSTRWSMWSWKGAALMSAALSVAGAVWVERRGCQWWFGMAGYVVILLFSLLAERYHSIAPPQYRRVTVLTAIGNGVLGVALIIGWFSYNGWLGIASGASAVLLAAAAIFLIWAAASPLPVEEATYEGPEDDPEIFPPSAPDNRSILKRCWLVEAYIAVMLLTILRFPPGLLEAALGVAFAYPAGRVLKPVMLRYRSLDGFPFGPGYEKFWLLSVGVVGGGPALIRLTMMGLKQMWPGLWAPVWHYGQPPHNAAWPFGGAVNVFVFVLSVDVFAAYVRRVHYANPINGNHGRANR